jgi:hypothetical protein
MLIQERKISVEILVMTLMGTVTMIYKEINTHMKGAQTRTPQKENYAERA